MSKFTLYRADIDSPRVARVLGAVPGVAVGADEGAEADDEPGPPTAPGGSDEDEGLRDRIPSPGTDIVGEGDASVVKTYGLLGLGVSMVALGIATVGIWVYRRQSGDESETPPPAEVDTGETAPTATPAPSTSGPESRVADTDPDPATPSPSIAQPDEKPKPRGRAEGDRTDVEWEARDAEPASEPETTDESAIQESAERGDGARPAESVDAAPLLGLAFLAASGAVVQWLQTGNEA
ncbi:hypothetical protein [Haloarcula laminariae]|uniref:hypothetical protein n=1 Tax=Haloarcula laminariae TaxID=2961577 RepID=UPI002404ABBB|nr:hypothetical protein [Halomicroarcula sp. FL173]